MRKIILFLLSILSSYAMAQNTFPATGNVGIGKTNPQFNLDVNGNTNINGQSWFSYGNISMSGYSWTNAALTTNSIEIVNNNSTVSNSSPTLGFHRYGSGGPQFRLAADGSNILYLESSGENSARSPIAYGGGPNLYFKKFQIDADLITTGNVGIGINTPAEKLSVNGNIRAKEVKVETADWPDYVFEKDYKMPSLRDLELYISVNKHLPDLPAAKEIEATGIELGEMNRKLLQKIEELTLYVIEQGKEISELKKQIGKN